MIEHLQFGKRRTPLIRQSEASECGLACLAMVAGHYGLDADLAALRRRFQLSLKGTTLKQLMGMAEDLGFSTRPIRCEVADLQNISLPAIVHWNLNHFVVLTKISKTISGHRFHINDPAIDKYTLDKKEVSDHFTGVVLDIAKATLISPAPLKLRLRISQLWSHIQGFWSLFQQMFLLSLIMQMCALILPFFMQLAIDTALPALDADLLIVLAFGFGGVAVVSMLASWLRSLVLVRLSTSLSYQVSINLFRHLLRLPLPWFERRHVGDVISRFGSTKPISDILSQGIIATLIDGILAVSTLILMLLYSPWLSAIAIAAIMLVTILRFMFFSALKHANVSMISAIARENSSFIETLRGVSTIKSFGQEANRQRVWQQKKAEAVNAEIKTAQINAGFSAGEQLISGIEQVLFIYISIRNVMAGSLTIGMVFAMQSYRQHFLDSVNRLVQQAISYRLLDMHLARIADIAYSQPENAGLQYSADGGRKSSVRITLRNVRFQYGINEPEVIRGINLDISAGEMVAFIGPSGNGKTTLMKLMMGLLEPSYGEILIDDIPLRDYGVLRWRKEIASVAQDDVLFAGTIADNISMFDPDSGDTVVEDAAERASIRSEIEKMPMRFHTMVGDMGSALSGGQKQRVMLARAIYRSPVALFLDEATAHLDPDSEYRVGKETKDMTCTRVIIAHRPQTIKRADRIFVIEAGLLKQVALLDS